LPVSHFQYRLGKRATHQPWFGWKIVVEMEIVFMMAYKIEKIVLVV